MLQQQYLSASLGEQHASHNLHQQQQPRLSLRLLSSGPLGRTQQRQHRSRSSGRRKLVEPLDGLGQHAHAHRRQQRLALLSVCQLRRVSLGARDGPRLLGLVQLQEGPPLLQRHGRQPVARLPLDAHRQHKGKKLLVKVPLCRLFAQQRGRAQRRDFDVAAAGATLLLRDGRKRYAPRSLLSHFPHLRPSQRSSIAGMSPMPATR
jgi:hypothetical protein